MATTPHPSTHHVPSPPSAWAAACSLSAALYALRAGYPSDAATSDGDGVTVRLQPRHAVHLAVRLTQDQSQGRI